MFEKVRNFVAEKKPVVIAGATTLGVGAANLLPIIANAEGDGNAEQTTTISSVLTTAFGQVQTDVTGYVQAALPYALGIMALIMGISLAVKAFKRFAK